MSTERRYDPKTVEPKWQAIWEQERTWEVSNDVGAGGEPYYVAEMLPYPSGEPHMGHLKNYAVGDAVAHFQRRVGRRVLHPIGYDAFGLPAENNAIKSGQHPRESTAQSIAALPTAPRPRSTGARSTPRCSPTSRSSTAAASAAARRSRRASSSSGSS